VSAFRVKLGANDVNCVDVPLNPTYSLTFQSKLNSSSLLFYLAYGFLKSPACYYVITPAIGAALFSGCRSSSACVRPCVRACFLLARAIS